MNRKGFTLLELIVAVGIFALVIGAVAEILIYSLRYNGIIWQQLQMQNDSRRVLQGVVDDVRKAQQSSIGSYNIEYAGDYELRFYSNTDADGYQEKVHYFLDGTTFKKGIIQPAGNPLVYATSTETIIEVAHNVLNKSENVPIFSYYDQNYYGAGNSLTQPVDPTAVKLIKIQMDVDSNPGKSPVLLHVESMVEIRSLKSN